MSQGGVARHAAPHSSSHKLAPTPQNTQREIIDETDQWLDNTESTRVSTLRLLASLPPAQRARVGRARMQQQSTQLRGRK